VFATGEPLLDFELTAELPSRRAIGHWNASYFPLKDDAGRVQHIGAIVLELTKRNELEAALVRLMDKLEAIKCVLHEDAIALEAVGGLVGPGNVAERSGVLLESCLSEIRVVSQLLREAPHLTAVRPHGVRTSMQAASPYTQELNVASMISMEEDRDGISPLSSREREIAALLAIGKRNKEIAASLMISARTVETHRARIMLKLDLHSLSDLVRYAVRNQYIQP
jgi:DNA-binding CsgD family transcriptional regulator